MSRARHKDMGGKVEPTVHPKAYDAQGSEVEKEAEEKKHGGRTGRAKGGHVDGKKSMMRLDRPGRKRGGRVGADMSPLTTASKVTDAKEHKAELGNSETGP